MVALLLPTLGWAQKEDCEQTIARATDEFNAGHFYSIPAILNECLKNFSREQKQRAFLLLTQTYLLLDDPIGAQRSFLEILMANPEFIPDEQLHVIDIVYLSKRFTATPIFSWMVSAGSNVSPVRVIRDIDVAATYVNQKANEHYNLKPGYHIGVAGEYSYHDHYTLRLGMDYLHTAYRSLSEHFDFDTKEFIDRQTWINFPLYVGYADHIGKYRPYGYAGYSLARMLSDRGSIALEKVTSRIEDDINGEKKIVKEKFPVSSPNLNLVDSRNKINQSLIFGGGLKYKIGLDFVFAELRYSVGLKNITKTNRLYGNYKFDQTSEKYVKSFEPPSAYTHVDDYFRLDNLSISFGFLRPLYKPRELKKARTMGVLRKMKKSK